MMKKASWGGTSKELPEAGQPFRPDVRIGENPFTDLGVGVGLKLAIAGLIIANANAAFIIGFAVVIVMLIDAEVLFACCFGLATRLPLENNCLLLGDGFVRGVAV